MIGRPKMMIPIVAAEMTKRVKKAMRERTFPSPSLGPMKRLMLDMTVATRAI